MNLAFSFNYSIFENIRHTSGVIDTILFFIAFRNLIHTMQSVFRLVIAEREVFRIEM